MRPPTWIRPDRATALAAAERLAAVSTLVAAAEQLTIDRDYRPGGLLDPADGRASAGVRRAPARAVVDLAARPWAAHTLSALQAAGAAALLAPSGRRTRLLAGAAITGATVLLRGRQRPGGDGAEQTGFCVHALATLARAGERDPGVVDSALWAIALQAVGSYAVSGWLKAGNPTWRSGAALPGMLRTAAYGHPGAHRVATRFPRATRLVASGAVAMESLMPLVYAAGGRGAPALLGGAAALHAGNAVVIGLNRFPWAFGATYPAVLYTAGPRGERSDALPVAAGAAMAVAGVGMAAGAVARRRRVRRGAPGDGFATLPDGRRIAHRLDGPGDGPLAVLVGGPMLASAQWANLRAALVAGGTAVLSYHRAGHGPSDDPPEAGPTTATDLVDLLAAVAPGREVVLVGHHLAAGPVLDAAARLPRVTGIALLDPAWPAPRAPSDPLAALTRSLRRGLGALLERPEWADDLLPGDRSAALAEYRDARLWTAAARERAAAGPPAPAAVPLTVVAAGRRPPGPAAPGNAAGRVVVVPGVQGDRLVTDPLAVPAVAAAVVALARGRGDSGVAR